MSTSLKSGSCFALLLALTIGANAACAGHAKGCAKVSSTKRRTVVASAVKSKKHGKRGHRNDRAWLIPPPPAYMPSILPESMMHSSSTQVADVSIDEEKPENPYKKYIYTPQGAPEPVQARKGVVTWTNR